MVVDTDKKDEFELPTPEKLLVILNSSFATFASTLKPTAAEYTANLECFLTVMPSITLYAQVVAKQPVDKQVLHYQALQNWLTANKNFFDALPQQTTYWTNSWLFSVRYAAVASKIDSLKNYVEQEITSFNSQQFSWEIELDQLGPEYFNAVYQFCSTKMTEASQAEAALKKTPAKKEEPRVEEAKKDDAPKVEKLQAQELKKEEPKAEAPKAEAPKVEAPKAEAPKAEAPKVEAPKKEEPKAAAPKVEEPKKEEPKVEEAKKEDAPKVQAQEPKAEAPKAEAPKAEAPKAEAPKKEEPKVEAPKVEAPKVEAPKAEAPKVEAPKKEEPKAEEPEAEEPKAEEPEAEQPKAPQPKAEAPKVAAPKVAAPKVEEPKKEDITFKTVTSFNKFLEELFLAQCKANKQTLFAHEIVIEQESWNNNPEQAEEFFNDYQKLKVAISSRHGIDSEDDPNDYAWVGDLQTIIKQREGIEKYENISIRDKKEELYLDDETVTNIKKSFLSIMRHQGYGWGALNPWWLLKRAIRNIKGANQGIHQIIQAYKMIKDGEQLPLPVTNKFPLRELFNWASLLKDNAILKNDMLSLKASLVLTANILPVLTAHVAGVHQADEQRKQQEEEAKRKAAAPGPYGARPVVPAPKKTYNDFSVDEKKAFWLQFNSDNASDYDRSIKNAYEANINLLQKKVTGETELAGGETTAIIMESLKVQYQFFQAIAREKRNGELPGFVSALGKWLWEQSGNPIEYPNIEVPEEIFSPVAPVVPAFDKATQAKAPPAAQNKVVPASTPKKSNKWQWWN